MKCDVLVVGAGASGSVAALSLSKKGFDVVVVEKCKKVGDHTQNKIDITEDVGLKKIIKELKLPIKDKTNKTRWFSPNYSFSLKSKIYDLYFKRGASEDCFEVEVINSAQDNGAKLFLNSNPKNINFKNNYVDSVIIKNNGKNYVIKPKIIIAADGFNSSMLNLLDLRMYEQRVVTFAGYGISGQNFDLPPSVTHIFFDRKNAPGGYFYIAKSCDGEGVACVVVDQSMNNRDIREHYLRIIKGNEHIKEILKNSIVKTTFQGKSHAGLLKKHLQRNVIFVGDAARTLDPILGYGVRNSIISAHIAADLTSNAIETNKLNKILEYESKIAPLVANINYSNYMRHIFRYLDNKDFDSIIKILNDLQEDGADLDEIISEKPLLIKHILLNFPRSMRLISKVGLSFLRKQNIKKE